MTVKRLKKFGLRPGDAVASLLPEGPDLITVRLALDAHVRKLLLFHHDPNHSDATIDAMVENAKRIVAKSGQPLEVEAAREGAEFSLN